MSDPLLSIGSYWPVLSTMDDPQRMINTIFNTILHSASTSSSDTLRPIKPVVVSQVMNASISVFPLSDGCQHQSVESVESVESVAVNIQVFFVSDH